MELETINRTNISLLKDLKTVEEMHEIETSYIMKYDSINCGYNCIVSKTPVVGQKKLFNIDK